MPWTAHNDFVAKNAETIWRGATPPNSANYYMVLCAGPITRTTTAAAIFADEVARSPVGSLSVGSYDLGQQRYELPLKSVNFTATGSTISFQSAVVMADSAASGTTGTPALIKDFGETKQILPGQTKPVDLEIAYFNAGNVSGV